MKRPTVRAALLFALCAASSVGMHAGLLSRAKAPLHKTDAALVDEANRVMALRATGTMDLGTFFLRAERGDGNPLLARWAERKQELARIGADGRMPLRDRVEWIVADLFRHDALGEYVRDSSTMARFFEPPDRGGNCEAETKLVVSALVASGIDLSGELVLGVQVFDDHVQPVLVDKKDKSVWSLVDGQKQKDVTAPVFDPAILLHAYVTGLDRTPSVSPEELVLLAPRGGKKGRASPGYVTDTKLAFPPAGVRHLAGEAPPRATLPLPNHPRDEKGEDDVYRTNALDGPLAPIEDVVERERCLVFAAGLIRVRDPADAAEFNRLGSYTARAKFVLDLTTHVMQSRKVPEEPIVEALRKKPVADLIDDLDAMHTVLDAAVCGRESIEALGIARSVYRKAPFAGLEGTLRDLALEIEDADEFKTARWRLDELQKFAADHPRELAFRLSKLPHRARVELLTLLAPTSTLDRVLLPLVRSVVMDDKRQDVSPEIQRRERTMVMFDVFDASETTVLVPEPPAPSAPAPFASAQKDEPWSQSRKALPVPVEVYVDIVTFALGRRNEARLRDKNLGAYLQKAKTEIERRDLLRDRRELAYRQAVFAGAVD